MSSGDEKRRVRWLALLVGASVAGASGSSRAADESPAPILQWFESSFRTVESRMPDLFMAGYGFVWLPPPYRADQGNLSVGYDVYDRFDLGQPGRPTLYGTEEGLKSVARSLHRAGLSLHVDFVMNHSGYSSSATPGFVKAGGYPGLAVTLGNDVDGDFHSAFAGGDENRRLEGLLDIAHEKNHRFIRSPVGPDNRNIPPGKTPSFGRLANTPDPANRRFYPQAGHNRIFVFDPHTNEANVPIDSFNLEDPMKGTPGVENATGYLMRSAQWLVQVIGVDGLRVDAAKHMPGFVFDFIDRSIYRQNPRRLLDGSQSDVFLYTEVFSGDPGVLLRHVQKTINHANPGRIGANRDTLDFKMYFALKENLERTGTPGAWQTIKGAALDLADDGLHNGSAGVTFIQSHDVFKPFALEHVAQAYNLMMPGNTIVYFNGREFGDERDFPRLGRGDALSVGRGSLLVRLLEARNTHGRGNYAERWDGTDGLFAFERQGAALVLLSNRGDAGFDSRTLTGLSFAPGTLLVELSGNAADPEVNPDRGNGRRDIPPVIRVFGENGTSKANVRFQRPGTIDNRGGFDFHGKGLLVYGLPTPEAPNGLELTNVSQVLAGNSAPRNDRENGLNRQTPISVITANTFDVRLRTQAVKLLGANELRDVDADGDEALLRFDAGLDLNGNGAVDFRTPGTTEYAFELFTTKHDPLIRNHNPNGPRGSGEYVQRIDATKLSEGVHFITARAYRRQNAGSPAVFRDFKKVIYVDRKPPETAVEALRPRGPGAANGDLTIRSKDGTADAVHAFVNPAAGTTDAQLLASARQGAGRLNQIDRALFSGGVQGLGPATNTVVVVAFETTGNASVQRIVVGGP